MQRILAAVDFSNVTGRVVEVAADLARRLEAQLRLMHADLLEAYFVHHGLDYAEGFEAQASLEAITGKRESSTRAMDELCRQVREAGVETTSVILEGETVIEILREAEKFEADLIVIGSHRHGRLYQAIFGGTQEAVISRAHCPVLVVPKE